MGITAKELAKKLNLSAAAVSMALNHKPGVSTQTRRLVIDTAEKYGYDFSRVMERRQQLTNVIYFIIYKKYGAIVADTPFFSQLSEGISRECKRQNLALKISYVYEEAAAIEQQIADIRGSDCSGILLLGTEMEAKDVAPFLSLSCPLLLLDAYFETLPCDCVLINNIQGAFIAAMHLIRKYKKQPGYLQSAYQISNFSERSSGFFKAIRFCGMSASKSIIHRLTPYIEGAYADMREILKANEELAPCYFADNDLIAIGAIKAFKEEGYKIPEDIAVIGFDNLPLTSVIEPALTTIHVPKQYMGEIAAQRLSAIINAPGQPPLKTEVATTLIKRKTA